MAAAEHDDETALGQRHRQRRAHREFRDRRITCLERAEQLYEAMGQGIGRWFLGAALEAAWSHRPNAVTVQTCTLDHPAALPLYQKLGFAPVGQKREMVRPMSFEERSASVMRP